MRTLTKIFLIVLTIGILFPQQACLGKIEAVKGKEYFLTKKHGPWMIMVAVFSEPPEELKGDGMSPEDAAHSLVHELRQKGIPAYTFWRKKSVESIHTLNRFQQQVEREYELDSEICVLAGNYNSPEAKDELAKRTLAWIKKNKPKCLEEGGIYKQTPGQPGPLSGAFLTVNPMLSPEEIKKRQKDPELISYNSHFDYSLLDSPGKYTVVVASFYGKSVTQVAGRGNVSKKLSEGFGLELATDQSWQVMKTLRENWNMEAYVFHDRKKSVVTVGSFNSKDDPRIRQIVQKFAAQWKTDPTTGQRSISGESLVLPSQNGPWMCTFDPEPKIMEIPYRD